MSLGSFMLSCVTGISADVIIQESQIVVTSELGEVIVYDSKANTKYEKVRVTLVIFTYIKESILYGSREGKSDL